MADYNPFSAALLDALRGFDRTFADRIANDLVSANTYPEIEYATRRIDESTYAVDLDLSGYDRSDVSLSQSAGTLTVTAKAVETVNPEFNKPEASTVFDLEPGVEVVSATFAKSILTVSFKRLVQDTAAPKRIPIN